MTDEAPDDSGMLRAVDRIDATPEDPETKLEDPATALEAPVLDTNAVLTVGEVAEVTEALTSAAAQ